MLSEWTAECGTHDPFIEVPWHSEDGALRWVDLRTDPDALDEIREADDHPALLAALRTLNAARSPAFTSKCDVWVMDKEELSALRDELMLDDGVAEAGMACYIDLLWRERGVFASRHRAEQRMHRIDRMARDLPFNLAKVECVLRHAVVDLESVQEGYGITLYVKGCGVDELEAEERWGAALRGVARMVRGLDATAK
jgi:hypothetical protein